jgi:hypothetical protein
MNFITSLLMPVYLFLGLVSPNYGSITTINGSDRLADSRTTINNNFADLDSRKANISDVSGTTTLSNLANIGTIVSAIWNATPIGVEYGGTGTTSPSTNHIMLGNGSQGLKTVSGLGTSGQFLQSAGAGNPPSWQTASVDTAGTYTWSGLHTFNAGLTSGATTTISASNVNSNALVLNGLPFSMNGTRAASSTVLMEDGSGNLRFQTQGLNPNNPAGRELSTTYQNTTGRPLFVSVTSRFLTVGNSVGTASENITVGNGTATSTAASFTVLYQANGNDIYGNMSAMVPPNFYYIVNKGSSGTATDTLNNWYEMTI